MATAIELLNQGRENEIWKRYCVFLNLSLKEFMQVQERLLLEQLQLLGTCQLGREIIGNGIPASVEEFRETVPLTTYEQYAPYLMDKREDVLPRRPFCWACTSGRSGGGRKWAPFTRESYELLNSYVFAGLLLGSSGKDRELLFEEGDTILYTLAPPPYLTGVVIAPGVLEHFPFRYLPPLEKGEKMDFQERVEEGFELALKEGMDIFYGLAGILVSVSDRFESGAGNMNPRLLLQPKVLYRVLKALVTSRLAKRSLMPKDLWKVKAIMTGGMDTVIYRDRIKEKWGRSPIEAFGGTETGFVSLQAGETDLTFIPDVGFLEFIPEDEHVKTRSDPDYHPRTVLLDEVQAGEVYVVVSTNFHGGPFVRYRPGDLVKITALQDTELGVNIPQMVFHSRVNDMIDISSFARLTEKTFWQALEKAGVNYQDWAIKKEVIKDRPILHCYIELKEDGRSEGELSELIHSCLATLDTDYRDAIDILSLGSPQMTMLSRGTFERYRLEKQAQGADLAHLKVPHILPSNSDGMVAQLLRLHAQG